MSKSNDLEIQIVALSEALSSFDSIYGLDQEHVDLLNHCANNDAENKVKKYKIGFLFNLIGSDISDVERHFVSEFSVAMEVLSVRSGKISGSLMTISMVVNSDKPLLILKAIADSSASVFDCDLFTDASSAKIELLSTVSEANIP